MATLSLSPAYPAYLANTGKSWLIGQRLLQARWPEFDSWDSPGRRWTFNFCKLSSDLHTCPIVQTPPLHPKLPSPRHKQTNIYIKVFFFNLERKDAIVSLGHSIPQLFWRQLLSSFWVEGRNRFHLGFSSRNTTFTLYLLSC